MGTQWWNQESPYIQFCSFNMKLEKFRSIRISYLMVKAGHHHSPHLIYQTAVDMPNVAQLGWNQHNSAWLPISILLLIAKTDEKRAVNLLFPSHSTVPILFCPKSVIPKFSQFTINFELTSLLVLKFIWILFLFMYIFHSSALNGSIEVTILYFFSQTYIDINLQNFMH